MVRPNNNASGSRNSQSRHDSSRTSLLRSITLRNAESEVRQSTRRMDRAWEADRQMERDREEERWGRVMERERERLQRNRSRVNSNGTSQTLDDSVQRLRTVLGQPRQDQAGEMASRWDDLLESTEDQMANRPAPEPTFRRFASRMSRRSPPSTPFISTLFGRSESSRRPESPSPPGPSSRSHFPRLSRRLRRNFRGEIDEDSPVGNWPHLLASTFGPRHLALGDYMVRMTFRGLMQ